MMSQDLTDTHRKLVAVRLIAARTRSGISLADAADRMGYRFTTQLELWEAGKRRPPLDVLVKMSLMYRVSTDFMLGLTAHYQSNPVRSFPPSIEEQQQAYRRGLEAAGQQTIFP